MKELIDKIVEFRDKRNWEQFHSIKDLLIGLNIEVGELQELYLWDKKPDIKDVEHEVADVFIFLAYLCKKLDIDLESAVLEKLEIHSEHYPVEKSKNKTTKHTEINKK
jgi:NTP pyrophosphatase (non-canonical NTP hydrolase)